jgi:hypothetical protein
MTKSREIFSIIVRSFVRKEYKDLKIVYSIYRLFIMSSNQTGGSSAVVASSSGGGGDTQQISRVPTYACFQHATKVAILEDKPIIFDYWTSSLEKTCLIGVRSNNEKLLVKSEDEYTSPIAKIFKVDTEYIIVTANSIYIVSADISTRRIN